MLLYIVHLGLAIWAYKRSNWGWRVVLPAVICFAGQLFALFTLIAIVSIMQVLYKVQFEETNLMMIAVATDLTFHAGAIIAYTVMIRKPRIPVIEAEVL